MFGNLVKASLTSSAVTMAIDGEMLPTRKSSCHRRRVHARPILGEINLHTVDLGPPDFIEFDSVINIRPSQGIRSRSVDDAAMPRPVASIVS